MAIIYCMFIHQYIHINIESILSSFSNKKFYELYSWRLSVDLFKELLNYKKKLAKFLNNKSILATNKFLQMPFECQYCVEQSRREHRVFRFYFEKKILFDPVYQNC